MDYKSKCAQWTAPPNARLLFDLFRSNIMLLEITSLVLKDESETVESAPLLVRLCWDQRRYVEVNAGNNGQCSDGGRR